MFDKKEKPNNENLGISYRVYFEKYLYDICTIYYGLATEFLFTSDVICMWRL